MDKAQFLLDLYRLLSGGVALYRSLAADDEVLKDAIAKARADGRELNAADMRAFGEHADDAKAALEAKYPWLAGGT